MSARRWILIVLGLSLLIGLSLPRYVHGVRAGDYSRAAQMVALIWLGFFLSARRFASDNPHAQRVLMIAAAVVCSPPLIYHLYDCTGFKDTAGNLILFTGIAFFTLGKAVRRETGAFS